MESVGIIEGSMTPPVSPHCMDNWYDDPIDDSLLLQQDEATIETEPSYLFIDCTDGHTSYNIENKATCATRQHQVLTRILSCQDPYPNQFQDTKVKLFGSHFVASTCLLDSKSLIFSLAKQTLGKLKLYLEKISHRALKESDTSDSSRLRHTCIVFLQYLKIYIHRHYKYDENSQCRHNQRLSGLSTALLFEIQGLSMYLGKMTDLPSSIFSQYISSSLKKQSIGHLFLHLILNVRWGLIEVLHLLYNKTKGFATENDVNNLLTTEVNILIDDLIDVARGRFKSISRRSYKNSSPFSCSCLQEFVILLIQFLDQRYDKFETDAFWVMLHKAFKKKVSLDEKGNVELYWWLIMHIAPLYNQNGGLIKDKSDIKSNWTVVGELLKLMFSQFS
ncbi:protein MMS22-like [Antedon mediterranea]|uniref:protein MMS22-like n=1 Tax=Antedon mediterranea TaxID=105859 RepID=UPI003AF867CC